MAASPKLCQCAAWHNYRKDPTPTALDHGIAVASEAIWHLQGYLAEERMPS